MEAPPLSAAPIPTPTPPVYPDSVESSPRSRHADSWDNNNNDQQPPPQTQKLRLMCSYGGHIVPRPHDKTLCYIGGDTRIIVIDRHSSLSDLAHRLSKTLLQNQSFSLKYQLPTEDLDSLISVATDEDLENMVEECDRLNSPNSGGSKPPAGRLRLFLFPKTSSSNIEQLLAETASTKSEDWFFNALNGKGSILSASDRGVSESSSVNCLLGLDDDLVAKTVAVGKDAEAARIGGNGNTGISNQDVHSVPDSPMLDTTSSFGSTSSSPSVANLPPIRVHVGESPKVGGSSGVEEQFQQMSVGNVNLGQVQQKHEEVGDFVAAGMVAPGVPVVVGGGDYPNRVFSDDERSDHGGYRKVQQTQPQVHVQVQPQQIPQFQQKQTPAFDSASLDSVSSEGSVRNPLSRQRQQAMYQESFIQLQPANIRVNPNQSDLQNIDQNNSNKVQIQQQQQQQQVQESGYVLSNQYDQNHPQIHHHQQFIHANNQYIPAGAMQYYPFYPSQQQHQPVLDQQYPFYFVPARQTQAYNLPVQQQQPPSYSEMSTIAPSACPQAPPPGAIAPQEAYNQAINAQSSKHEMAAGVYRTTAAGQTPQPQLVQVPVSQHQQAQYVGYTQIHHPTQSMAPSSAANSAYAYEFADPSHAQMYYATQHLPPQVATAQYQTLTSAPAVVLSDASTQMPSEKQQQVRVVQP